MSHFLGGAANALGPWLPKPDERVWPLWFKVVPYGLPEEVRWPRTQLRSGNFVIDQYNAAPMVWDWQSYAYSSGWGGASSGISGVTRDVNGNVLATVTVKLFDGVTDALLDERISDSNGNFFVCVSATNAAYNGSTVYLRAEGSGVSGASGYLTPA